MVHVAAGPMPRDEQRLSFSVERRLVYRRCFFRNDIDTPLKRSLRSIGREGGNHEVEHSGSDGTRGAGRAASERRRRAAARRRGHLVGDQGGESRLVAPGRARPGAVLGRPGLARRQDGVRELPSRSRLGRGPAPVLARRARRVDLAAFAHGLQLGRPADAPLGRRHAESRTAGPLGSPPLHAGLAKRRELDYATQFRAAFPTDAEPLSTRNYGLAIQAYEATLVTPAAFDRFLAGDDAALSERQKAGLRAFLSIGCAACHNGPQLGGAMLSRFGIVKDFWLETGSQKVDPGRFAVTKKEEDRYVFRVPMLRNIAKTAPYFHDGSVETLEGAVRVMASVQLGRTLDERTVADVVSFLEALTGEVPSNYAPPGEPVVRR